MAGSRGRRWVRWLYRVHLWVGVVVALQLLLWTASGLFMTSVAMDTVHGDHLRRPAASVDLRSVGRILPIGTVLTEATEGAELAVVAGRPVYRLNAGGRRWLVDARTGERWTLSAADAVAIAGAAMAIEGRPVVTPVGDPPPLELRQPGGAWRVAWPDGTSVYVGAGGQIMAVRTGLWRWFDFAWGLHILDPFEREDTHHPLLIASAALSLFSVISGIVLIVLYFRRRA